MGDPVYSDDVYTHNEFGKKKFIKKMYLSLLLTDSYISKYSHSRETVQI